MINGYEIRENTVTPNSVFLFLLRADEDGRKKIEDNLSAFCKLTNFKMKGFDYVFELSGITDDNMLDKFKNQVDSLSSDIRGVTQTFANASKTETITLSNSKDLPKIGDANLNISLREEAKEEVGFPSMPSVNMHEEKDPVHLSNANMDICKEKENNAFEGLTFNHKLQNYEMSDIKVEGNSLHIEQTIPSIHKDLSSEGNAPVMQEEAEMQNLMPSIEKDKISETERANYEGRSFSAAEMKNVAISIEKPKQKKSLFGGLMGKIKNMFASSKETVKTYMAEQQQKKEKKEIPQAQPQPERNRNLFGQKEVKKEEAPVVEEKAKNPFQDLGSGIIVKKSLLTPNDDVEDKLQKEKEDLLTNPITAKVEVDDIFAAETVYDIYADRQQDHSGKNIDFEQNQQNYEADTVKLSAMPSEKKEEPAKPQEEPVKLQEETQDSVLLDIQPAPQKQKQESVAETQTASAFIKDTLEVRNIFDDKKTETKEQEIPELKIKAKEIIPQEKEEKMPEIQAKETVPQEKDLKEEYDIKKIIEKNKKEDKTSMANTVDLSSIFKEPTQQQETLPSFDELQQETQQEAKKLTESHKQEEKGMPVLAPIQKKEEKPKPKEETPVQKQEKVSLRELPAEEEKKSKRTNKLEGLIGEKKEAPKQKPVQEADKSPALQMAVVKAEPKKAQAVAEEKPSLQPKKEVQEETPVTPKQEQDLKKENKIMQEIKNEEVSNQQGEAIGGMKRDFTSKSESIKRKDNIDHTLHVGTPAKGTKYRNYPIEMPLIPTYTFANMDISPMRFAHAMAMSTLESLGVSNNPFLLQGVSGTGKTHFLHAMGYEISKQIPQSKILFTNGVRFSRGIQYSLEKGQRDKLDAFFNGMQVLIIDDVHLTAVNEHNREYISKILNDFLKNKKQLIFSSKYPPESLKRFEELVNFKFALGTITELKVPNKTHFSRLVNKLVTGANLELTETQVNEYFCNRCASLGEVARDIKRIKVLSRRIESSGNNLVSCENILKMMTGISGENESSEIVNKNFEDITVLTKNSDDKWGNFGFFFPASQIDKFRWVAFASQEAAKELGIKGGFNYSLKSAYSTEHIISAAFKIANICDVKGLKGAVILGPSLMEVKEPIRDNFYDILTHMLEVMMIRCGTINFEDIKKPSAYIKMLGDILK